MGQATCIVHSDVKVFVPTARLSLCMQVHGLSSDPGCLFKQELNIMTNAPKASNMDLSLGSQGKL